MSNDPRVALLRKLERLLGGAEALRTIATQVEKSGPHAVATPEQLRASAAVLDELAAGLVRDAEED